MSIAQQRLVFAVRIALGLGLLGLVLATTDRQAIARAFAGANPWIVLPAIAGLVVVHVIPALAWRSMGGDALRRRLTLAEAVRTYYTGQALGAVTPANLAGDVYRVSRMRSAGIGWMEAGGPIAVQRATSYLALAALALGGFVMVAPFGIGGALLPGGLAVVAIIGVGAGILLSPPAWLQRRMSRMGALPDRRTRLRVLAVGIGSGLVFHAVAIALTWVILVAVDARLGSAAVLAAVAVARCAIALPLTPSGIGIQEGALAALVAATGGPAPVAVAGMLLARGGLVATVAVGAFAWVVPRRHRAEVGTGVAIGARQR